MIQNTGPQPGGCRTEGLTGLARQVHQTVLAAFGWTGQPPPRGELEQLARNLGAPRTRSWPSSPRPTRRPRQPPRGHRQAAHPGWRARYRHRRVRQPAAGRATSPAPGGGDPGVNCDSGPL